MRERIQVWRGIVACGVAAFAMLWVGMATVALPFAGGQVLYGAPRDLRTEGGQMRFAIPPLERVVVK